MKDARRLRREIDLWGVVWQQVETFVDRVAGAQDQDASARRTLEALLTVAGVVERARATVDEDASLGAPVVRSFASQRREPDGSTAAIGDAWSAENRAARLPGLDELELAAGPVSALDENGAPLEDDLTSVALLAPRLVPTGVDTRTGTVTLGLLPSYDPQATEPAGTIVATVPRVYDIAGDDADLTSLFSVERRVTATMGEEPETVHVQTWRELAGRRRGARGDQTPVPVDAVSGAGRAAVLASTAVDVVDRLRAGELSAGAAAVELAALLAAPAVQGSTNDAADALALETAAEILDDEGTSTPELAGAVRALAAALRATPGAQQALVAAVGTLAAAPSSAAAQDAVLLRAQALGLSSGTSGLAADPVEDGMLGQDLDDATASRLSYPDGSLRMVRALESAFALTWPMRAAWFAERRALVLAPLVARFRAPFHASVRALVDGGDTGLLADGLTVGASVPVGATSVVTGQPASLAPVLDDLEPGQVGIVPGERPAVLAVLGLDTAHGLLQLSVAPVRVSVQGGPGVPGLLADGGAISGGAGGLTDTELRSGESAAGPAADGVVAETLALWSQLCLLFGRQSVETAAVAVPEPASVPLDGLVLQGAVPPWATTLVLTELPEAFWDRTDPSDPAPRVARPGELLLVRGTTLLDDGGTEIVQAVVEVDTVVRTTGSALDAMDVTAVGRLSTGPVDAVTPGVPAFRCGPQDDVVIVTLRRSSLDVELSGPLTLRRDFHGFDVVCLATQRLVPPELLGGDPDPVPGVDRSREFSLAAAVLADWLRYANHG